MVLWTGALERREGRTEETSGTDAPLPESLVAPRRTGIVDRVLTALLPGLHGRRDGSDRRSPVRPQPVPMVRE